MEMLRFVALTDSTTLDVIFSRLGAVGVVEQSTDVK
jgi:hypothetical protein